MDISENPIDGEVVSCCVVEDARSVGGDRATDFWQHKGVFSVDAIACESTQTCRNRAVNL